MHVNVQCSVALAAKKQVIVLVQKYKSYILLFNLHV